MLGINNYVLAAVGGLVLSMGLYIWWQNSEIETLQENNVKLEQSVEQQQKVVEQTKQDMKDYREAVARITREREMLSRELEGLRNRFNKVKPDGAQRDLGKIAILKPRLLERVVNPATKEANRCLEISMGAELTEEERNATKRSEINSECPGIANPNYSE